MTLTFDELPTTDVKQLVNHYIRQLRSHRLIEQPGAYLWVKEHGSSVGSSARRDWVRGGDPSPHSSVPIGRVHVHMFLPSAAHDEVTARWTHGLAHAVHLAEIGDLRRAATYASKDFDTSTGSGHRYHPAHGFAPEPEIEYVDSESSAFALLADRMGGEADEVWVSDGPHRVHHLQWNTRTV